MNFNNLNTIYFIGIGGIGMSALARYFKKIGKQVSGYDKTQTTLTNNLINEGIPVSFIDSPNTINTPNLFIYTPAVPQNNKILNWAKSTKTPLLKRSEVLGYLSNQIPTLAISGTHGKTSVSALLTHLLAVNNSPINAFLGGIALNFNSNLVYHKEALFQVMEADEYDRSFLKLKPYLSIITSVDADHLDIYQNHQELINAYVQFANLIPNKHPEKLIINSNISVKLNTSYNTYSISNTTSNYYASNIKIKNHRYWFNFTYPGGVINDIELGIPGRHNVENATAAAAAAHVIGVLPDQIKHGLKTFKGVKRRFERIFESPEMVYFDDYAHHPKEIEAFILSVKEMYPKEKICGIFQPHLFSRTKDFADQFAQVLSLLDYCFLLEIYPAREEPIQGITSSWLAQKISDTQVKVIDKQDVINQIEKCPTKVFVTMGAGDIDLIVEPLKLHFEKNFG